MPTDKQLQAAFDNTWYAMDTAPKDGTIIRGKMKDGTTMLISYENKRWENAGGRVMKPLTWQHIDDEQESVMWQNITMAGSIPHMNVWNMLVSILLLPQTDLTIKSVALGYLTKLNQQNGNGESISTAFNALQWIRSIS